MSSACTGITASPPRLAHSALLVCILLSCVASSCTTAPPPLTPVPSEAKTKNDTPLEPAVLAKMWRVVGDHIEDGQGMIVQLRGIAFGNQVWDNVAIPSAHHNGSDFRRVAQMGMNSVRFYLNYRSLEQDEQPYVYDQTGWDWIDQNVEWAKAAGVRLVLNMHSPVGGYQSQGEGALLWEDAEAQERFVEMWRAIADRYRAQPTIAGYDILNEPHPTKSIKQWKELAERTISAIRDVDQHHVIFVERVNAVAGDWSENEDRNFFLVADQNVVYEFHFYKPYHFTHQGAEWSDFAARESWYPDENAVAVDWFQLKTEVRADSDPLPSDASEWRFLETEPLTVDDPKLQVGKPFLVCDAAGEGKAIFDSLSLTKIPPLADDSRMKNRWSKQSSPEPETVFELDLDTRRGWYFWSEDGSGQAEFEPSGHGDGTALSIRGTRGPANLGSDPLRFFLEQGTTYQLHALARGNDLSNRSRCLLRLEFFSSKVPVVGRDKGFLQQELEAYVRWGRRHDVPLYLGEFGTIAASFQPGRGGLAWVKDVLSLALHYDLSFAYHAYHENDFGMFSGDGQLPRPSELNQPLYELFLETLGGEED